MLDIIKNIIKKITCGSFHSACTIKGDPSDRPRLIIANSANDDSGLLLAINTFKEIDPDTIKLLIEKATPTKFGYWEIPKDKIIEVDIGLNEKVLNKIKKDLGLAASSILEAEIHNMLISEQRQFFKTHQDIEKCNESTGTLIAILPTQYTGGEIVIENKIENNVEQHTMPTKPLKNKINLIAFYSDCYHAFTPVTSGYMIILTYNLLLLKGL